MKSNRVLRIGGIVLLAAFAMGRSVRASPLSGDSLSTGGSLSMADTQMGIIMESYWVMPVLSFDACSGDDCSETEDAAAALTSDNGFVTPEGSFAVVAAAPEPASFVLVGLILAVLPLIRKRRS